MFWHPGDELENPLRFSGYFAEGRRRSRIGALHRVLYGARRQLLTDRPRGAGLCAVWRGHGHIAFRCVAAREIFALLTLAVR